MVQQKGAAVGMNFFCLAERRNGGKMNSPGSRLVRDPVYTRTLLMLGNEPRKRGDGEIPKATARLR